MVHGEVHVYGLSLPVGNLDGSFGDENKKVNFSIDEKALLG